MATDSKQKLVEDGVAQFAAVEKQLSTAFDMLMKLSGIWMKGNALGMMGALETGELTWRTKEVAGMVAAALEFTYILHKRGTDIAQINGWDVPGTESGGGGR